MSSVKYELPAPPSPRESFVLQVGSETCLATRIVYKASQVNPLGTVGERRPEPPGSWGISCLTFHQVSLIPTYLHVLRPRGHCPCLAPSGRVTPRGPVGVSHTGQLQFTAGQLSGLW